MNARPYLMLIACILICCSIKTAWHLYEPPVNEKPIVIIIPSYNNSQWCQRNLESIYTQKYSNYRVIYIDDHSTDDTYEQVQNYIAQNKHLSRTQLIRNQENQGALKNLFDAIYSCKDTDIIVTLDGDDFLKNDGVLKKINATYQDEKTWITYGQYEVYPEGYLGSCREIPDWVKERNAYRSYHWVSSHLRTFYAGLFKKIKIEDLQYDGKFFDVTWDMAFMFPMLEMAREHATFIPDVLYIYNQANPINDYKIKFQRQQYFNQYIRSKSRYEPIKELVRT